MAAHVPSLSRGPAAPCPLSLSRLHGYHFCSLDTQVENARVALDLYRSDVDNWEGAVSKVIQ
ncbi:hypothetical protein H0H81_012091 [Sphagnurus paluster]|uniref:Uncharacterized protein n=1 Tax=Sphagnurus paluster TaxID=117069 RepID=A0A9P7GPF3_9AGAR|nr:hypothetical protein H0H81_012091 [Sphagnurus paluster]